jgi:hypothetical protein
VTPLTKPLKRELTVHNRLYVVTLPPQSIKVTPKGTCPARLWLPAAG